MRYLDILKRAGTKPSTTGAATTYNNPGSVSGMDRIAEQSTMDNFNRSSLSSEKGASLAPALMQSTRQSASTNAWNSFANAIDDIHKSAYEGRKIELDNEIDKLAEEAEQISKSNISEEDKASRLNNIQGRISEIQNSEKYRTLEDDIIAQDVDIADTPVDIEYQQDQHEAEMEENTNIFKYLKYELPKELGGSASELGWQIGTQAAAYGGKKLAQTLISRAGAAAVGGPLAPAIIAGMGISGATAALYSLYQMRDSESEAEKNDAFKQRVEKKVANYVEETGQEPDENTLRKIRLEAHDGLDRVYAQNMNLMLGDAADVLLASLPWAKGIKLLRGTRATRAIRNLGTGVASAYNEGMEETDQYSIKEQYLRGKYKDGSGFGDNLTESLNHRKDSIDYAFIDESGEGYEEDVEYRNAFRSGAILGGVMGGANAAGSTLGDERTFKNTRRILESAKPHELKEGKAAYRANLYSNFFGNDKAEFLIEGLTNLAKNTTDPEHAAEAIKEVELAKKARKSYDDIDRLYKLAPAEVKQNAFKDYIKGTQRLDDIKENDAKIAALIAEEDMKAYMELMDDDAPVVKKKAEVRAIDNILTQYLAMEEDNMPSNMKRHEQILKPLYTEKLQEYREALSNAYSKEADITYTSFDSMVKLMENRINNSSEESIIKDELATIADPKKYYTKSKEAKKPKEASKSFNISNATLEEYTSFEDRNMAKQRLANRYEEEKNKGYTRYISDRLEKEDLQDVMSGIVDRKLGISDEVNNLVEDKLKALDSAKATDDARYEDLQETEGINGVLEDDEQAEWDSILERRKEYEGITEPRTRYSEFVTANRAKPNNNTDNAVRRQIKEKFLKLTTGIKDRFFKNDDYVNIAEVDYQLSVLKNLKALTEAREDEVKGSTEFAGLIDTIDAQIIDLQNIRDTVDQRLKDIKGKDARVLNNFNIISLNEIGLDANGNVIPEKKAVHDEIRKLVGDAKFDAIIKANKDKGGSYIYSAIIKELAKRSTEDKVDLLHAIEQAKDTLFDRMMNFSRVKANPTVNVPAFYSANNTTGFLVMMARIGGLPARGGILDKYTKERDLIELINDAKAATEDTGLFPKDELVAIAETHLQYSTLVSLEEDLSDTTSELGVDTATELKTEEEASKVGDRFAPTPSNQQLLAIRQMVRFFRQDFDKTAKFKGWSYLRGYAGTGKTNVVIRWVVKLLGLKANEIYAASYSDKAAEHIAKSLGLPKANTIDTLIADLTSGNIGAEVKAIIIDEIGGVTTSNLDLLREAIIALNATRTEPVRVIAMGDPNQITSEGFYAPIDRIGMEGTENITYITPLTIRYRSNVSSIVDVQDLFIDQDKDLTTTPIHASSNTLTPESFKGDLVGVNGGNFDQNIIAILKNRRKDDGRRRAIIVNDDAAVQKYKQLLADNGITGVDVITYVQSQGDTINEVYVNVTKDGTFGREADYNKAVYTAVSRATDYIYLGFIPVENNLSPNIEANANKRQDDHKQRSVDFLAAREEELTAIEEFDESFTAPAPTNKKPVTTTTKPTTPTGTTVTNSDTGNVPDEDELVPEDEVETEEEEMPVQVTFDPAGVDPNREIHTLSFSSSDSIERTGKDGSVTRKGIKKGSPVQYVKTINRQTGVARIEIIGQLDNGSYVQVGVIGQEELNNPPAGLEEVFSRLKASLLDTSIESSSPYAATPDVVPVIPEEGIVEEASILHYIYGKTDADNRPLNLVDTIGRFVTSFFGHLGVGELAAMESKVRTTSEITIFNKITLGQYLKDQSKLGTSDGFVPKVGIPYIKLTNLGTTGIPAKDQFIRLTPRKLNATNHSELVRPVLDFIRVSKELHALFGNVLTHKQFSDIVQSTDQYVNDLLNDKYSFVDAAEVHRLRKEVDTLAYSREADIPEADKKKFFKDAYVIHTAADKKFDKPRIIKSISKGIAKIVVGGNTIQIPVEELERVPNPDREDGPAQKAFNAIASANLEVDNHLLRQQVEWTEDGKKKRVVRGKKLLVKKDKTTPSDAMNTKFHERLLRRIEKEGGSINKDDLQATMDELHKVITIDDLDAMFSFDPTTGDSVAKRGFGIRVPIGIKQFAGTPSGSEKYLSESFDGVNPTRISISLPARKGTGAPLGSEEATVTAEVDGSAVADLDALDDLDDFLHKEEGENVERLGGLITTNKAIFKYLKGLIPNMSMSDVHIVAEAQMLRITKGVKAWGLVRNYTMYLEGDAKTGGVREKVLRHEGFHIVTNYFMSMVDRNKMYQIARRDYAELRNATDSEIREALARKFQEWKTKRGPVTIALLRIFNKIANALGFIRDNFESIEMMFEKVEEGAFMTASAQPLISDEFYIKIAETYGTTDNYKKARMYVVQQMSKFMFNNAEVNESKPDAMLPRTFNEAKVELVAFFQAVKAKHDDIVAKGSTLEANHLQQLEICNILLSHNGNGKLHNLDDIVQDIFPSRKANHDIEYEGVEDETHAVAEGLSDYFNDSDLRNSRSEAGNITRDTLSTITYQSGERKGVVDFATAFSILLQVLPNVDTTDFDIMLQQIKARFGNVVDANSKKVDPVRKAIYDRIETLVNGVSKGAKFHKKTVANDLEFKTVDKDGLNFNGRGFDITKKQGETTANFFIRLKEETGLSYNDMKGVYQRYDHGKKLAALMTSISSYREKGVKIGTRATTRMVDDPMTGGKIKERTLLYRLIGIGEIGEESVLRAEIENRITDAMTEVVADATNPNIIPSAAKIGEDYYNNFIKKDPEKAIRDFFGDIGLDRHMHLHQIDAMYESIKNLVDALGNVGNENGTIVNEEGETIKTFITVGSVMNDNHNRVDDIISAVMFDSPEVRNLSYMSADGKKRQNNILSSGAADILSSFTDPHLAKSRPKFLKQKFYSEYNIFATGLGKIFPQRSGNAVIDYDGLKDEQDKMKPVLYTDESEADWFVRSLDLAFVSMLKNASAAKGALRYIQSFYTISNKPQALGAEVGLLSDDEVKQALTLAIKQQASRGDHRVKSYNKDKKFVKETLDAAYADLERMANDMADRIIELEVPFDEELYKVYNKLKGEKKNYLSKKFKDHKLDNAIRSTEYTTNEETGKNERKYIVKKEDILPIIDLFVKNNYVNGLFLNQLVMGDQAFYASTEDEIKRMSIAFGMGHKLMVNDNGFLPESFNVIVAKETKMDIDAEFAQYAKIVNMELDSTDGTAFCLPGWSELARKSGPDLNLGPLMKPVHFEVDPIAVPRAMKYALIELSDDLLYKTVNGKRVVQFPKLLALREKMENHKGPDGKSKIIHQFVYASGFKVGAPLVEDQYDSLAGGDFNESAILTLQSKFWRIQQNPMHAIDSPTANPTQLTFFVNLNGKNKVAGDRLFQLNGKLINRGLRGIKMMLQTNGKFSADKIRNKVVSSMKGEQDRRQAEMLMSKDKNGYHLSINFPTLINKILTSVSSVISKSSVGFKFPGSKLVLQADFGVHNPKTSETLKWRDDKGYAEVIMPNMYKEWFQEGDLLMEGALGFRIPSTELHSAIPLRVVGFYDDQGSNAVIAPKEIVLFHGSDYDIDALYVMRREIHRKENVGTWLYKGQVVGTDANNEIVEGYVDALESHLKEVNRIIKATKDDAYKAELKAEYKVLNTALDVAIKNEIVETFLTVIRNKDNEEGMMTPISTYRMDGKDDATKDYAEDTIFYKIRKAYEAVGKPFKPELNLNNAMHQAIIHGFNHSGSKLVGYTASAVKGFAYLLQGTKDGVVKILDTVKDKEGNDVQIGIEYNGIVHDTLSNNEYVNVDGVKTIRSYDKEVTYKNKEGEMVTETKKVIPLVSEIWDSVINAALDNVKLQALPEINFTNMTAASYVGMMATGIPFESIVWMMLTPAIRKISTSRNGNDARRDVKRAIKNAIEVQLKIENEKHQTNLTLEQVVEVAKGLSIDDNKLTSLWARSNDSIESLNLGELEIQYAVLERFEMANKIGEQISDTSKFMKVLQQLPVTEEGVRDYVQLYDKLASPTSIFRDSKVLDIPHVNEAYYALKTLDALVTKMFHKHDSNLYEFAKKIRDLTHIKLDFNENKNLRMIRDEFVKYVMTDISYPIDGGTFTLNTLNEEPYIKAGRTYEIVGADAWNQRFIDQLRAVKTEERKKSFANRNKFLQNLEIKNNFKTGLDYIRFTKTGGMTPMDFIDMQKAFEELKGESENYTALQHDFVKYAALNFGVQFGSTNYSMVLPPALYAPLSAELDKRFDTILHSNTSYHLGNITNHFAIQAGFNNASDLGSRYDPTKVLDDKGKERTYGKEVDEASGVEVRFDLKYEVQEGVDYPLVIKYFEDSYIKLAKLGAEEGKFVYYQKLGREPISKYYQFAMELTRRGYDYTKVFRPNVTVRKVVDVNKNSYDANSHIGLQVGDTLALVNRNDIARLSMIDWKVSKVIEHKTGDKVTKVTYKLTNPKPVNVYGVQPEMSKPATKEEASEALGDDAKNNCKTKD